MNSISMHMHHFIPVALLLSCALSACGGGGSDNDAFADPVMSSVSSTARDKSNSPPAISFQVRYKPESGSWLYPHGVVDVFPPADQFALRPSTVTKVEFLLFGYEAQVLTQPNVVPKDSAQLHYVFAIPAGFGPGSYVCGSGEHLSEVRVTNANNQVLSSTFELCPGVPFETSAPVDRL